MIPSSHSRGQVSIETLTLVGFTLVFFIPLILLFFASTTQKGDEASIMQARLAGRQIADNAGEVFLQGEGSRREAVVNFPPNLLDISAQGRQVVFKLSTSKGELDIVTATFVNVSEGSQWFNYSQSGKIPSGTRVVALSTIRNGKNLYVEVSDGSNRQ